MKAMFSEQYYLENWERYEAKSKINPEEELEYRLRPFADTFRAEDLEKISKVYAQNIAEKVEAELKKTMRMINDLEAGRASLGYTSQRQEVQEMANLRRMFEFNCLQLKLFKQARM